MILLRCNWNLDYYWRAGSERRRDVGWQDARERIFCDYTLPSLQRQTAADWQCWLRCDLDLAPLTRGMEDRLAEHRVSVEYDIRARSIRWARQQWASGSERIIFARIDSDDMLHPEALARLEAETEPGLVQFGDGYAWDIREGRLYEWNHPSSPFIAEIDALETMRYGCPELGGHHGRVHQFARRIDDKRYYMVMLHDGNVCNGTGSRWLGRELTGVELARVWAEFLE